MFPNLLLVLWLVYTKLDVCRPQTTMIASKNLVQILITQRRQKVKFFGGKEICASVSLIANGESHVGDKFEVIKLIPSYFMGRIRIFLNFSLLSGILIWYPLHSLKGSFHFSILLNKQTNKITCFFPPPPPSIPIFLLASNFQNPLSSTEHMTFYYIPGRGCLFLPRHLLTF